VKFETNEATALKIIPLGGLGELGLNMMLVEYGDQIIVIDCGFMFPNDRQLGVDLVIPEMTYVRENADRVKAVVLTHGHEDHTGAMPFLLDFVDAPIYGTRLTLGLLEEKLKEYQRITARRLIPVSVGDSIEMGPIEIEFIRVSHSIVGGAGLAVISPLGTILHTGDFKIDQAPVDGAMIDLNRFAMYGERGVLALLSDSTNVEVEGYTLSESDVSSVLDPIFRDAPGRMIVALFSSHIHRIQQIINLAARHGRYVGLVGRNVVANTRIAHEMKYLDIPPDTLIDLKDLDRVEPDRLTLITTGSQGEPMSALSLIAMGQHKYVKVLPGDTVVLSSKFIPGNEKAINDLINFLYRRGAEVIYDKISDVHVSGHASKEELKFMIKLTKPRYFIPIHGEYRHLVKHCQLAAQTGIPAERILLAEDGDVVEFTEGAARIAGKVPAGKVFVDGKGVGDVGPVVLRDRRKLSEDGMVIVVMVINQQNGEITFGPDIVSRGFVFEDESQELLEEAKQIVLDAWPNIGLEIKQDWAETREEVKKLLKRFFNRELKRKPVILPLIIQM
jgi:ribonuclease J